MPYAARRLIVFTFFMFFAGINIEMGSISAAAPNMQKDLNIDKEQLAFMFSISYFVCGAMTLLMPPAMNRFDARTVLMVTQLLNALGASTFVLFSDYRLLIVGRIMGGTAQAFICSYTTVWINEFAPKASQTTWMAYVPLAAATGSFSGSIIGSFAAGS